MYEFLERPELDDPVLVLALDGWIDAGLSGASAREVMLGERDRIVVANFDADMLLDHRARRPTVHLADGVNTGLSWPSIELIAFTDDAGHDVLGLVGAEPDHTWRAFATTAVGLALELGVRLVVGLGAYPAPVPHTRPTRVVATATDAELAQLVGFVPGRIDVPAGIHAAIEQRCAAVGLPATGLWAQVPHYVAAMPYPSAAIALLDALGRVAQLSFDQGPLAEQAEVTRGHIDELVGANPEHQAMVTALEQQVDAADQLGETPLPSGDELAAELERFLRDQDS